MFAPRCCAEMQHVVPRASEPPKRTVLLRRTLIARVGFGALCLLIVAGSYALATGWEVAVLRSSAAAAQREALASAHASAVHLVSRTLALRVLHRERSIMQVHALAQGRRSLDSSTTPQHGARSRGRLGRSRHGRETGRV